MKSGWWINKYVLDLTEVPENLGGWLDYKWIAQVGYSDTQVEVG
jgi:hypothetical protein